MRRLVLGAALFTAAWAVPITEGRIVLPPPSVRPPLLRPPTERDLLEQRLRALTQRFPGDVGVAVRRLDANWTVSVNGDRPMPQQSVSKRRTEASSP